MIRVETITIAECRLREEKQMIREEAPQEEEDVDVTEQIIVNPSFPDQMVTIGGRLSKGCKEQLKTLLKGNMEVFRRNTGRHELGPSKGHRACSSIVNLPSSSMSERRKNFFLFPGKKRGSYQGSNRMDQSRDSPSGQIPDIYLQPSLSQEV
ncbi:hypothetical protein Tco_0006331 [Tanacetum coccineum]